MTLDFRRLSYAVSTIFRGRALGFDHLRNGVEGTSFSSSPCKIGSCNRFHKNGFNLNYTPSTSSFSHLEPSP